MTFAEFIKRFREEAAEIVILDEHTAMPGTYSDFFVSYCFLKGDLYSLNMSCPVVPDYQLRLPEYHEERERYRERLFLNRYRQNESGYEIAEQVDLAGGEYPRVVSNGERAYAVIVAGNRLPEYEMLLYDLVEQRLLPISVAMPDFDYGTSWQPFLVGSRLFCVTRLTPFCLLEIDVATGTANIVQENDVQFNMLDFDMTQPLLVGSSNAIQSNENIIGLGFTATQSYRNTPFFWFADADARMQVSFTPFFSRLNAIGYNIIRPTSLFVEDDDIWLGLYCAEREHGHAQRVANILVALRAQAVGNGSATLATGLADRPRTKVQGRPNLKHHLFFCPEMERSKDSRHALGGLTGRFDVAGHLVFGPYLELLDEATYCAELSYFSRDAGEERAGLFEVTVADETLSEFETLGEAELPYTDGSLAQARITFDTKGHVGKLLELRVFVEANVDVTVFHIRTWLAGDDDTADCRRGD